ncbi:MAG: hypothetical protein P4L69_14815 [Desulfosporosinus sp.]|nr:hypothetical protein [Desulfosporosinus sp.]
MNGTVSIDTGKKYDPDQAQNFLNVAMQSSTFASALSELTSAGISVVVRSSTLPPVKQSGSECEFLIEQSSI